MPGLSLKKNKKLISSVKLIIPEISCQFLPLSFCLYLFSCLSLLFLYLSIYISRGQLRIMFCLSLHSFFPPSFFLLCLLLFLVALTSIIHTPLQRQPPGGLIKHERGRERDWRGEMEMQRSGNNSKEDKSMFETLKYTKHRLEIRMWVEINIWLISQDLENMFVQVSLFSVWGNQFWNLSLKTFL